MKEVMPQVQFGLTLEIAQAYLQTDEFAFDSETDTSDQHWVTGDRGLSYCTFPFMLSFYAPNLPPLVLMAQCYEESYETEVYDEIDSVYRVQDYLPVYKKKQWIKQPLVRKVWYYSEDELAFIREMFGRENYTAIAHQLVFDARLVFGKFEIPIPDTAKFWCTLSMGLTGAWLNPNNDSDDEDDIAGKDLLTLGKQFCDAQEWTWWSNMKTYRTKLYDIFTHSEKYEGKVTPEDAVKYSAMDAYVAYQLYESQRSRPVYGADKTTFQLENYPELIDLDVEFMSWCVEASTKGIKLNENYARKLRQKFLDEYYSLLPELGLDRSNEELHRSPVWRNRYFYGLVKKEGYEQFVTLNLPEPTQAMLVAYPKLKTDSGAYSFGKDAMKVYLDENSPSFHPELKTFARITKLETNIKTLDEWLRNAEYDGRLHSITFINTVTGRCSSSSPNGQNIDLHEFAGVLNADDGYCFIELDYSNAENWINAGYCGDNKFAERCAATDFHEAMREVWGVATRKESKILTFGTAYGMGKRKLAYSLGKSVEEAGVLLDNKRKAFPNVARTADKASAFAEKNGFTIAWSGRRVRIRSYNGKFKGYTAINTLCQSGVAELTKRAIIQIRRWLKKNGYKSYIATQIHDAIILALWIEEYDEVIPHVIEIMATVMPNSFNQRTTPNIRWLTDVDHYGNSLKWGYNPDQKYPFDTMTYSNRWGTFHFTEADWDKKDKKYKAPVFINEFGHGPEALAKELGGFQGLPETPKPKIEEPIVYESFNWSLLQKAFEDVKPTLVGGTYNNKLLDYKTFIALQRELCHRGETSLYLDFLEIYDRLSDVMKKYSEWRDRGGKYC